MSPILDPDRHAPATTRVDRTAPRGVSANTACGDRRTTQPSWTLTASTPPWNASDRLVLAGYSAIGSPRPASTSPQDVSRPIPRRPPIRLDHRPIAGATLPPRSRAVARECGREASPHENLVDAEWTCCLISNVLTGDAEICRLAAKIELKPTPGLEPGTPSLRETWAAASHNRR